MEKIKAIDGDLPVIASRAFSDEMTAFGSENTKANDLKSLIIDVKENIEKGWSITPKNELPTKQDFNGLFKAISLLQAYSLQMGIAEYSKTRTYFKGSFVNDSGRLYLSLIDNNVGKALTDIKAWAEYSDNSFNPNKLYEPGDLVKIDGIWYECYHPDGCKGKDPRDGKNRPFGWADKDESHPYFWIKIGRWLSFPEIGSPIYLPTTNIREGLIKYRNDGKLHKNKFWRIAELYPNLIKDNYLEIADLRSIFLRGLDDDRGVDKERAINSYQDDAIRNIIGGIDTGGDSKWQLFDNANGWGAMSINKRAYKNWTGDLADGHPECPASFDFNASRVVPTANENRPRNIAMLIGTRF